MANKKVQNAGMEMVKQGCLLTILVPLLVFMGMMMLIVFR